MEYLLRYQELGAKAPGTSNAVFRKRGYAEPQCELVYSNARAPVDFVCKPMKFDAEQKQSVLLRKNPPCMIAF
jgi:hypothetical protein